ncbi:MAG: TolC family protein [Kiritimatiellae bacterium]|nr:TolC family protein [Kiritimatiellia bacterium]
MGERFFAKALNTCLMAAAVLAAGCGTTVQDRARISEDFRSRLAAETADHFAANPGPLSLKDAVALARRRTLKLTRQELERELSRVTRASAFSAFLPNAELAYGRFRAHGDATLSPYLRVRGGDGRYDGTALLVTQPVFAPVAWTMFAEAQYGTRISDLVRDRARQLLDVQVAACFYKAAVSARMAETRRLNIATGEALTNRIGRLAAEGYAIPAERARAEARLAGDELGYAEALDESRKARSDLSSILTFWPLAEYAIDGDSILGVLDEPWVFVDTNGAPRSVSREELERTDVAEFVWQGLLQRKDLYAGDETVNLRKAQVVEALAGFLPDIVLGGGASDFSAESLSVKGWTGGLAGTWAAFEGFRSVQAYRAARARSEAEFRLQEDRMLAVVTSVADAWRNWKETAARVKAARKMREAAALDHADAERRHDDGQETMDRVLDKLAVRDEAEVRAVSAEYAAALAEIALRQAVGLGLFETEEKENEEDRDDED